MNKDKPEPKIIWKPVNVRPATLEKLKRLQKRMTKPGFRVPSLNDIILKLIEEKKLHISY